MTSLLLLVHLVSFAAYIGAGFAQQQLMKRSLEKTGEVQRELEALAAAIVTKIEVPAILGSVVSGIGFVAQNPVLLKQGWLHGKLACVVALTILSHLEMFNARKIARGEGGPSEVAQRKKRHATMGAIGTIAVVGLLVCVTFVRLGL